MHETVKALTANEYRWHGWWQCEPGLEKSFKKFLRFF